jgi:hypothetical protein
MNAKSIPSVVRNLIFFFNCALYVGHKITIPHVKVIFKIIGTSFSSSTFICSPYSWQFKLNSLLLAQYAHNKYPAALIIEDPKQL